MSPPTQLDEGIQTITRVLHTLTNGSGVYRMLNARGEILYIGKAKNLKKRVVAYTKTDTLPYRLQRMVSETRAMEIVTTATEVEALLLESNLIKRIQPRYNVLLKDDKSFPYILLTKNHPFPRVAKHRGPQTLKGDYYGPFANVSAVDEAILVIQKLFHMRNCTDSYFQNRTRPCLQYHIKRCSAPCVSRITEDSYKESVSYAKNFLTGKTDAVQQALSAQMMCFSHAMDFEKAAEIRDILKLITDIQAKQRINLSGLNDADIIGIQKKAGLTCVQIFFFRHGRNYGTESFFLAHAQDESEASSLNSFVLQFYQERSPAPLILLSHEPDEYELIQDALAYHHGIRPKFEFPKQLYI